MSAIDRSIAVEYRESEPHLSSAINWKQAENNWLQTKMHAGNDADHGFLEHKIETETSYLDHGMLLAPQLIGHASIMQC